MMSNQITDPTTLMIKKMCDRIITIDPELFSPEARLATKRVIDWMFAQDSGEAAGTLRMAKYASMRYDFLSCNGGYANDCVYWLTQAADAWKLHMPYERWADAYVIPFTKCFNDACEFEANYLAHKGA